MVTSQAFFHRSRKAQPYVRPVEIGPLKPSQLLVKTDYASLNPVDLKLHSLTFRDKEYHTVKDFAGTVAEIGSDLKGKYEVGQRVCGSVHRVTNDNFVGSYTLLEPLKHDWAISVPGKLTDAEASSIGVVYSTAFELLERCDKGKTLGPDSKILVLGGSTTAGSYVLQLAKKYFSVGKVVATSSPSSASYAREFGADDTISYTQPNVSQAFVDYVKEQGSKFDAIVDCVGGYDALAVYPDILKPRCEGSVYVTISGDVPPTASYAQYMLKSLLSLPRSGLRALFGPLLGINYQIFLVSWRQSLSAANDFFSTPGVRAPIDSTYSIDEFTEAWKRLDSGRAKGKIVIKIQ